MVWLRQGEYIDRFVQDFWMCIDDIFVQQGDDLWAIMDHAMHVWLETADKTILIGSDTVDISHSEIEEAFVHLETHDMVIWPTNDGGYRMIGSTAPAWDILLDMEYSTQTVYEETLARMDTSSKTYMRMRTHIDVDTIQDLEAARAWRPDIYDEIRQEISTLKTE